MERGLMPLFTPLESPAIYDWDIWAELLIKWVGLEILSFLMGFNWIGNL